MKLSVLTLVRHRRDHLVNLMRSLEAQQQRPDELVIAWMQSTRECDLPETSFPVQHVMVEGDALPLARARNAAVEAASFEALVFLDVDCIASPGLIKRYHEALQTKAALYIGEVHYLPADAVRYRGDHDSKNGHDGGDMDLERLTQLGERHPARPALSPHEMRHEADHGQLWGLSFALMRTDHWRAGGMDEGYVGYGGEETDYAWRLAAAEIPLYWLGGALAWHQHHPLHAPPYPHLEAIVANARRFHARWGHWCMDYWLGQFRDAGVIDWSPEADDIKVLRAPTEQEIDDARLPSSARYC
ncbi:glycosyl transferase family A [Kushneria pakistanensis]|uniref:Glycosyl transferase family A n=1 Tax=Kushneria pakistanensis TaxID=1508770 RepID=A0ABQ3FMJ0_9GAMM|nr:glycosyltransferase [Kushneria pakistanensis]GHC30329.1 glycosyl transferase family A [Kushneria pakistanensis]